MTGQTETWRGEAEAIWTAAPFDHLAAARLLAEIMRASRHPHLIEAARQALPSLRHAATREAETFRQSIARRRFGTVRDALHQMGGPAFGRRAGFDTETEPRTHAAPMAEGAELRHRSSLGLPAYGSLREPDIQAAYRRAAKAIHPDRGGTTDAFVHLVAARDALLGRG